MEFVIYAFAFIGLISAAVIVMVIVAGRCVITPDENITTEAQLYQRFNKGKS